MTASQRELWIALLASRAAGGPRRAVKHLLQAGRAHLLTLIAELSEVERSDAHNTAVRLHDAGVQALLCDDPRYPDRLRCFAGSPPVLFCRGNVDLLKGSAVGVCGARDASTEAIRAARACGQDAARLGVTVVSGYAKGVDTESHLAALNASGSTIAVLAEGIDHFRVKTSYRGLPEAALGRMLVISQFPPGQRWTAGAAMTRNHVIVGLAHALVVVEARESGGTLKAGELALKEKRRLLVLAGSVEVSQGNKQLLTAGARRIGNRAELVDAFGRLDTEQPQQLRLG
ncbi:DNA-processing protein DprA [Kutzneria albida]|uniref:DNA-processing protein DprA n=1 Tax=Kutzneria albida TaxID=43357 RepID=UPI00130ED7F1|nr:DNA-processing protein DprA [Kutzneria albida]